MSEPRTWEGYRDVRGEPDTSGDDWLIGLQRGVSAVRQDFRGNFPTVNREVIHEAITALG